MVNSRNVYDMFKRMTYAKTMGVKPFIDDADKIIQIAKDNKITKGEVIRIIIHNWFELSEGKTTHPKEG